MVALIREDDDPAIIIAGRMIGLWYFDSRTDGDCLREVCMKLFKYCLREVCMIINTTYRISRSYFQTKRGF